MRLIVSVVVFKSDPRLLIETLQSLNAAVRYAKYQMPQLSVSLYAIENEYIKQLNLKQVEAFVELSKGASEFDRVEFKVTGSNLGYGKGHNLAIGSYEGGVDYHLVLNPDVVVSKKALYEGLSYMTAHPEAVLLAPKVVDNEGQNLYPCKRYPALLDLALRGFAPIWLKNWFARRLNNYEMHELAAMSEPVSNVDIVSGCYMLLRSDAFKAVNGFDERFFLYFEDFDLSLRIRSEGEVVYLPSMEIAHYGGSAAKKGFTHITLFAQSAWKFYQRHGWRWI